jgi:ATP-dependent DNA ligase
VTFDEWDAYATDGGCNGYKPVSRRTARLFSAMRAHGCEGMVSKRLGSPYHSGRSAHWVKVKNPKAPAVKREAEEDWGKRRPTRMSILEQAINCDDGERAAKIIQNALGIESDDVVNYCFPKTWPVDREQRASIIGPKPPMPVAKSGRAAAEQQKRGTAD